MTILKLEMAAKLSFHSKYISGSSKHIEILTISDHLRYNQNRTNIHEGKKIIDKFNERISQLDNIIKKKDIKNINVLNETANMSMRSIHKKRDSNVVLILETLNGKIADNDGSPVKVNLSNYTQNQNSSTKENADGQNRGIIFDTNISPGGINYKSSLFKSRSFSLNGNIKSKNHVKRFRRQSPFAFAIAQSLSALNEIGLTDPGNVQGAPLAFGGGGFIFGGPGVLGSIQGDGDSIYDTNLGALPFVDPPAAIPSPTTTASITKPPVGFNTDIPLW